ASVRLTRAVLTLALVVAAAFVAPAGATSVTSAQLRELARAAQSDPAALGRLRGVDEVDGRAVNLRVALGGAAGEELDHRLRVLAGAAGAGAAAPKSARDDARGILKQRRFQRHEAPHPFRGILTY